MVVVPRMEQNLIWERTQRRAQTVRSARRRLVSGLDRWNFRASDHVFCVASPFADRPLRTGISEAVRTVNKVRKKAPCQHRGHMMRNHGYAWIS